uniref:PHD finger protein 7 n=1 Tax=Canis lupus dingo TaxID=286419 RepID=A0A8C0JJK0_CANLU
MLQGALIGSSKTTLYFFLLLYRKSAKTRRVTQKKPSSRPVCRLCLREPGDPEKLGEFLQKDNLSVHYFCLILSSKLPQRGQSNRGFHGFLPEDIKKEAARASRKKYAHTSAKHFFKCPQCNNREEFPQEMLRMGIHIPDRDAAWELEPGAFSELYQRYQHCDAPICLYEQGRDSFEEEGRWRLILCATCGSHGTHRDCSSLRSNSKKWECEDAEFSTTNIDMLLWREAVCREINFMGRDLCVICP